MGASVSGFLISAPASTEASIDATDVLYNMENPELDVQKSELHSLIRQLTIQLQSKLGIDSRISEQTALQLENAQKQFDHLESQIAHLKLSVDVSGEFIPPPESPRQGKFIRQGEQLGTVCRGPWIVHAMLTADQWS